MNTKTIEINISNSVDYNCYSYDELAQRVRTENMHEYDDANSIVCNYIIRDIDTFNKSFDINDIRDIVEYIIIEHGIPVDSTDIFYEVLASIIYYNTTDDGEFVNHGVNPDPHLSERQYNEIREFMSKIYDEIKIYGINRLAPDNEATISLKQK